MEAVICVPPSDRRAEGGRRDRMEAATAPRAMNPTGVVARC